MNKNRAGLARPLFLPWRRGLDRFYHRRAEFAIRHYYQNFLAKTLAFCAIR